MSALAAAVASVAALPPLEDDEIAAVALAREEVRVRATCARRHALYRSSTLRACSAPHAPLRVQ